MTIQELIGEYDFTSNVRNELYIAYDESPEGFERIVHRAEKLKNPPAAITSMIRSGQHLKADSGPGDAKPARDTLDDIAAIAVRAYTARARKYPPVDERGWTDDDAISYGVWVASTWSNERWSQDDIERAMRIRIGKPWTDDQDPALGTGCPPELKQRILVGLRGFGDMPSVTPEPALKIDADELAHRLLAEADPTTQSLAERLLATLGG